MAPSPLDIKLEIVLDERSESSKYFPGDQITGIVYLTANQNYSVRNFRLAWTGRIQVQPIQSNKESRIYFNECWKLGPSLRKSPKKAQKGSSHVPFYFTHLISVNEQHSLQEPRMELQKNKPLGLTFAVRVPSDRPLPSCTEIGVPSANKIIYLLEAFIDETQKQQPVFFTQKTVPVFEPIYSRTPEMTTPQRAEQVFVVSLSSGEKREFTSAMRVTLPCRGSQAGISIPVSISIWNNMEFTRRQGISISLYRINQVVANGRVYTSQGEKIHRVVTDLNIKLESNNQKVQTVRIGIPIPRGTTPTINFEQSQLLSIKYYIRVQVFAQEGIYTTADGKKTQFMMVDLPFVIGTLSTPSLYPSSSSPTSSSISLPMPSHASPVSFVSQQNSMNGQPSFDQRYMSDTINDHRQRRSSSITTFSSCTLTEDSSIKTKHSMTIKNVFRKSSTTSSSSSESTNGDKKKKNIFSTLRLYRGTKDPYFQLPASQVTMETTGTTDQPDDDITPTVVMVPKDNNNTAEPQQPDTNHQGGVFDIFAYDNDEIIMDEKKKKSSHHFNMFPDEDDKSDDDGFNPTEVHTQTRFNMFPDEDEEEEDQPTTTAIATDTGENQQQSNVFKLFDDDDDDEEEDDQIASVLSEQTAVTRDERVKPHR
ncbi:MAG: hypothetical protein EXX96DRAFT_560483, partial [Benjaminiella poitrasii]